MDERIERRFENVCKSKTFNNILRRYALGTKRVLDIGCSYGEYLAHFGNGSVGLTTIEREVTYGKARGLDLRNQDIEATHGKELGLFDVIFSNNLLEHLNAPHPFLVKLRNLLTKDGFLVLGVPCVPRITSLMRFKKFRGSLAESHINFFTYKTLMLDVERAGWRIEAVRGFHFSSALLDTLLRPIYPHFYIIAKPR